MFFKFSVLVLLGSLAAVGAERACGPQPCPPQPLCGSKVFGLEGTFNVALIDSMRVFESDIEGRVTIGGSANIHNYLIGDALRGYSLLTNGGLTYSSLGVWGGNTYYRTTLPFQGDNGVFRLYSGDQYNRAFGFDASLMRFDYFADYLRKLAVSLATGANGQVVAEGGVLTLTGKDLVDNRFYVTSEQIAAATTIRIVTPKGSTVTVDVSGNCVTFAPGVTVVREGVSKDQLVFNFFAAEKVIFSGVRQFVGVVLAPRAVVTADGTQFEGELRVGAVTGSLRTVFNPFQGCYNLKFAGDTEAKLTCSLDLWGDMAPYEVFVTGTAYLHDSWIGGRMAVGGAADLRNTTIGAELPLDAFKGPWRDGSNYITFTLGGGLEFTDGRIVNGMTGYADSRATHVERVAWEGYADTNLASIGSWLATDFQLWALELSHLNVNGKTQFVSDGVNAISLGTLVLTGTDKALNVFDVLADDLTRATKLVIDVPEGATVLVRVSGKQVDIANCRLIYEGATRERTLFFLPDATNFHLSSLVFKGSVFAPNAAVEFYSGRLEGHLFARSLNGNGQINWNPFLGCLPLQ